MNIYAGHKIEKENEIKYASGGAASEIASAFIKQGGFVYGVRYTDDYYDALYACAKNVTEITQFQGSKYFRKRRNHLMDEIGQRLINGEKVLFIGLGCDIYAVKSLIKQKEISEGGLYTLELLCDGTTSSKVHKEYLKKLEEAFHSKIVYFTTRYKLHEWINLYIFAEFENGQHFEEPFYKSDFGYAFANYKEKGCYTCVFKGKNHLGDIILGDYWGCKPGMAVYDEKGVSLMIPMNDKGQYLLELIAGNGFYVKQIEAEYALYNNPRFFNNHEQNERWEEFDRLFTEKGLHAAVQQHIGFADSRSDLEVAFHILDNLCKVYEENRSIEDYFIENNLKRIAIYGAGKVGKHLYRTLKHTNVDVLYMIDKRAEQIKDWGIKIYGVPDDYPEVDAVIISVAKYYYEIEKVLRPLIPNTRIISAETIVSYTS